MSRLLSVASSTFCFSVLFWFALVFLLGRSARADLVTFDELNTWTATGPTGSYFNGNAGNGRNTNGWSSNGVYFGNSFNTSSFGDFWNGFAYSNINAPTTPGFMNQYAANRPTGVGGGGNYAVAYSGSQAFWNMQRPSVLQSIFVTNTAYTMYSILDGDRFAKKFGGPDGNDPDFFSVRFEGFDSLGGNGTSTGVVDFFLADYRFRDNALDYVVRDWTQVDLSSLGAVQSVRITFKSSDFSIFDGREFINTPTYVALDNLAFSAVPEPSSWLMLGVLAGGMLARRMRKRDKDAA
jgi:hypothetical protein